MSINYRTGLIPETKEKELREERKKRNEEFQKSIENKRIEENERLFSLINKGPVPTTIENVRLVLKYLNENNWGGWELPAMTIGYSANQYDCDGSVATTITLDKGISDEDYGIENENMFVVGAPHGHLNKYQRL